MGKGLELGNVIFNYDGVDKLLFMGLIDVGY